MTLFATRFASNGGTRLDGAVEMIAAGGRRPNSSVPCSIAISTTPILHRATIRPPSTWKPHGWS